MSDAIGKRAAPAPKQGFHTRLRNRIDTIDLVPDLGANIGSRKWWRGLATLTLLVTTAATTSPGMTALPSLGEPAMRTADWNEARAQAIAPLALGGDTGRRMAASDRVRPLASTPERPRIELVASIGEGDSFARVLERSGVGSGDAVRIAELVVGAVPLADIPAGTRIDLVLGRRPSRTVARPVDALAFRAAFDLQLELERSGGELRLNRMPIAVDRTPLRIRGKVGSSLYLAARAAGAPAAAVASYLKAVSTQIPVGTIAADDEFDIIVEHKRAETGEVETGSLLYAGLVRDGRPKLRMLSWAQGSKTQFFEASGVGEQRGGLAAPVAGRASSNFGMRRHPILGYRRMHAGMDYTAGHGQPIFAVTDGRVAFAGRKGGYGNFVRLGHDGGLGSGYGHMSRIAVYPGQSVRRGQVIGYVGSTGLSTGPHLHYELYRNGQAVNPASVRYVQRAQLSGTELVAFRAKLNTVTRVEPGAALAPMRSRRMASSAPVTEASRLP